MQVDVGGFMVNFDQSMKKLICPLCASPYACYSSLRKHVLKDHEPNQNQVLCRFGNCRTKFKDRDDAASHLRDAHNSARDDKYLKTLPLHLGDFFKARCGVAGVAVDAAADGAAATGEPENVKDAKHGPIEGGESVTDDATPPEGFLAKTKQLSE